MHSPWSRAVVDPKRVKPRANSGLSFSGAHLLDPQYPTTRSHSVPLSIVPPYAYHFEPSLWESAKTTVATEGPAHLVPTAPAGPESIPSYEEKSLLPARQDYTQVNWLPYSIEPLPTVAEELSEEQTEEGEAHRLSTQSEPPPATQVQDQKVNMSVISYPYPAPLDYERGHHYHPNLNSTITSNPPMSGYDPLHPTDDGHHQSVGSLDDSAGSYSMSHEFPPSHVLNALANSTSSSSSPTSVSSKEAELARLRRKNNYTRRQSKTKIRRQRSVEPPTTAYLPRSCGQDYGLGIQYSSAPGMQASITSQPMGGPPFMEPYEETISPAVQHVYPPEYYGHPAEFTLDNYQISYAVHGASESPQAMYPPYTVPTLPSINVSAPHVGGGADAMYATTAAGTNRGLSHSPGAEEGVRVITARPKPQCWEHGCNGRQFSTFSNLLRHQREKSGTATKSYCPKCGAEFTRTTARNGHMAHEKCKPRTEA